MLFLAQEIHGNPSFIFTLIQKFNKLNQEPISIHPNRKSWSTSSKKKYTY